MRTERGGSRGAPAAQMGAAPLAALLLIMLTLGAADASRLAATQTPAAAAAPAATAPPPAAAPPAAALPVAAVIGAAPKAPAAAAPAAAAAAAAAPAAAPPDVPGPDPDKVFHLGIIVPLSGGKANTGRAVKAAVEMAVRDLAPTKLPGVKVELLPEDTKCGDVGALWGGRKLARLHVEAMIGEVCSAASLGALGVINKFQIPLISPASTSPALSIKDDYFFRTVPPDRFQGQFAAKRMLQSGAKAVVIASTSDSYGQELSYNFIAAFTRDGGKAFDVEMPAEAADKNASAVVDAIRANNADGVFIATNDVNWGSEIIRLIRTAKPPLNVAIFGGDSLMDATVVQKIGKDLARGVRGSDVSFGTPEFQAAFKEYTKGQNISYNAKAAHAYDATWALIEAYARAPASKEGKDILNALKDLRFEGKSGPIAFDEFGDLKYDGKHRLYQVVEFDSQGGVSPVPDAPAKPAPAKAAAPKAAAPAKAGRR